MYVVYRRKGFQDTPISVFEHEGQAREALERFREVGQHYLKEEEDDSYAVQRMREVTRRKLELLAEVEESTRSAARKTQCR